VTNKNVGQSDNNMDRSHSYEDIKNITLMNSSGYMSDQSTINQNKNVRISQDGIIMQQQRISPS